MEDIGALADGYSSARAINNRGQVVGTLSLANGELHGFLFDRGARIDLGNNVLPYGINDNGEIVGETAPPGEIYHAFLMRHRRLMHLGTLPGGTNSTAYAINSSGVMVGQSNGGGHRHALRVSTGRHARLRDIPWWNH